MNGQDYVDSLKIRLDRINDQDEIQRLLNNAVAELRDQGYSDEEIQKFFQREYLCEAQDSSNMIKNHQKYREMVARILGDKKK